MDSHDPDGKLYESLLYSDVEYIRQYVDKYGINYVAVLIRSGTRQFNLSDDLIDYLSGFKEARDALILSIIVQHNIDKLEYILKSISDNDDKIDYFIAVITRYYLSCENDNLKDIVEFKLCYPF